MRNFFTIRMSLDTDNTLTKLLKQDAKEIEITQLNQHFEKINADSCFFLCIGGGKTASDWWAAPEYKGFLFIASLISGPQKYDERNYKITVKILYKYNKPITKKDYVYYPDSYDTVAAPATKGSQTQAISLLEDEKQVLALLRGGLFYDPDSEDFYISYFGEEFVKKIKQPITRLIEKTYSYDDEIKALSSSYDLQNEIETRAKLFKQYLQTVAKKSDGDPLSDKTVSNYMWGITQKDLVSFAKQYTGKDSILLETDIKKIDEIYKDLLESKINESSHQTYSSALLIYKEFLIYSKPFDINNFPLILYGPPGTGKTYEMQTQYLCNFSKENCFVTTFHQAFSYEEFIEGVKAFIPTGTSNVGYRIEPGLFYLACERAVQLANYRSLKACLDDSYENRKQKFEEAVANNKFVLLCIDEINRANVSSVFGDLISLIENSKRLGAENEMTGILPYSKTEFGVPKNLLIIGTMNTADRSIQLLDSALRRRFQFKELLPNYNAIKSTKAVSILKNINNRIRALLDKDHQIGHSYFIGKNTNVEILRVIQNNIIPLLEEYFYNETDKIRRVLNETDELKDDTTHKNDYFYILDDEAKKAVKDNDEFDEDKEFFKLNENLQCSDEESAGMILKHLE